MKKLGVIIMFLLLTVGCGNRQTAKTQTANESDSKDHVEVLYFHGKQRCMTCNAIEKLTKEVLDSNFMQQIQNGEIVFKTIDISDESNQEIVDKYEITWSSLLINGFKNGKEMTDNITDFAFSYAKGSPDIFKSRLKKKIDAVLAGESPTTSLDTINK